MFGKWTNAVIPMLALLLIFGMWSCVDSASQKRLDDLVAENEALATKQRDLVAKQKAVAEDLKAGKIDPVAVAQVIADTTKAVTEVTEQMKKNITAIKEIKDSGNTMPAIIGAIAGTLGRSLLHAFAGGATGGLGNLAGLLLGGSSQTPVAKKEDT